MDNPLHITIGNDFAEIAKVHAAVERFGKQFNIPPDALYAINLALDELLANIINYAFNDSAHHPIAVSLRYDESETHIVIVDDGRPFNPLEAPPPDLSSELQDRPVGGLGIHLVKSVMTSLHYKRERGKNVVTLSRAL